jgi:hypothetical protein
MIILFTWFGARVQARYLTQEGRLNRSAIARCEHGGSDGSDGL